MKFTSALLISLSCTACATFHPATCDDVAKDFMSTPEPIKFAQSLPGGIALIKAGADLHGKAVLFTNSAKTKAQLEQAGVKFDGQCQAPNGTMVDVGYDDDVGVQEQKQPGVGA